MNKEVEINSKIETGVVYTVYADDCLAGIFTILEEAQSLAKYMINRQEEYCSYDHDYHWSFEHVNIYKTKMNKDILNKHLSFENEPKSVETWDEDFSGKHVVWHHKIWN